MPHANRLSVEIMAMMAEEEGLAISARTKAALAAAKARGTRLGGDRGVIPTAKMIKRSAAARHARAASRAADRHIAPTIKELQANGVTSVRGIAAKLNEAGIPTARRDGTWSAVQVSRVLELLPTSR